MATGPTGDDETASGATRADRPSVAGGRDETASSATGERPAGEETTTDATHADGPGAIGSASRSPRPTTPTIEDPGAAALAAEATVDLPSNTATAITAPPTAISPAFDSTPSIARSIPGSPATTLTTAADAMHDEEVERTRMFIRAGWAISVAAIGTVPFLGAPLAMNVAFIAALVLGMVVSFVYHQAFADPRTYSEKALLVLAIMCIINAEVSILFYGAFTVPPVIVVVGIHFVARTEEQRAAFWILITALVCHTLVCLPIMLGIVEDPGVFATDRPLPQWVWVLGWAFVLGMYTLAWTTARTFRRASLESIEGLQKATRTASQREALMDELRADLERALRVGGPGRYSDQVVGEFKLGIVLGRGSMGEVYEAFHTGSGGAAAVKLLRRELLSDPTHVARFLREVRASGALDTPHAVKILDASSEDAAVPFLAMERLRGKTLAELLRESPRLPMIEVAELVRQIGAGVDAAAAASIVHRDLKPQNIFREDKSHTWKVLDFGVATLLEESSGTLTQGGVVGTPNYMAPEQAQGKRVDSRADLYAIAAVAYRALGGRHAFNAPDTPSLLYAVVHKMPTRPGELVEYLHADVDRWFALALAKAPDDRFATGIVLATTFAAAIAGELDPKLRKRADGLMRKHPWD